MRDDSLLYRKDIDGWRALAVTAVVLHHFDKDWLPGGYLGVDVFFVISGFVITLAILNRDAPSLPAFLADFYARRMRRLTPALVVCVVATSVAIWLVDPASRQSLSTGLGALFGVSNILLAHQDVDYFSPSTELNAFTHTWSLGVEEQFYLVYPLLLWGLAGRKRDALSIRRLALALAAALAISAAVFVATASSHPAFNYFHLPARFWELAAGALACLATRGWRGAGGDRLPISAAAVLGVALVLPLDQRVLATLLAVAATSVLLARGPSSRALNAALTTPALRFIGRLSYPLYLWHWSVLAVSRFTIGVSPATAPAQFALMLALAWATTRWIEFPVRRGWALRADRRVLIAGLALLLASAAVPVTLRLTDRLGPLRSAALDLVPEGFLPVLGTNEPFENVCLIDGVKHRRKADTIERCTAAPDRPDKTTIWAFGDSHAGHLQPMLYALRARMGVGVHEVAVANTPFPAVAESALSAEGKAIFDSVRPRFRTGDVVVLARFFFYRDGPQRAQPDIAAWAQKAAALARELEPQGVNVVIVAPLPVFRYASVLSCARSQTSDACAPDRAPLAAMVEGVTQEIKAATQGLANVVVFEPFATLCPPARVSCTPFRDGQLAFRDQDHLTIVGSAALAEPFMAQLGLAAKAR